MAIPPPADAGPRSTFDPDEPAPAVPRPLPQHSRRPSTVVIAALAAALVILVLVLAL